MANKLRLDRAGMAEMLKSAGLARDVEAAAQRVAANVGEVSTHDGPVPATVSTYTTDRAAAAVSIAHPAGIGLEAKYGVLAKAAAAAGLEVRAKGRS